jgi:hypothetical protein
MLGSFKGTVHRNSPVVAKELKQGIFAPDIIIYKPSCSIDYFHRCLQIYLYVDVTN